jgi:NADH:ubiquinone oxidoreductase subunit E
MQAIVPSLISVGQASQLLQRSPTEINSAATQLGIAPAERRNFVTYYHEADLERVREHLAKDLRKDHRGGG